jgi:hypothetical protein
MRSTLALTAALLVLPAHPLFAQAPDGSANRAAIDQLEFMVGRWRGEAWMQRGPGARVQTTMSETVERKLGGVVLLVEGVGTVVDTASGAARTVHHALAVVSFDPQTGAYGMRSYIATGQAGDFVLTLIPGGVSWTREVPGGRVRNTAQIGNGEWHEIGEFSRDGVAWTQIMDIRLRREP